MTEKLQSQVLISHVHFTEVTKKEKRMFDISGQQENSKT